MQKELTKIIKLLEDINLNTEQISLETSDKINYEIEYQIRILNDNISKNSKISFWQNIIMIVLTIAILYLTYIMSGLSF